MNTLKDINIEESEMNMAPAVHFSVESGVCEIVGGSYMGNPPVFYKPLYEWIQKFVELEKPIMLNMRMEGFNTSTSKSLLEIFTLLKLLKDKGAEVTVRWFYDPENDDVKEEVEDLEYEALLQIEHVLVESVDDDEN